MPVLFEGATGANYRDRMFVGTASVLRFIEVLVRLCSVSKSGESLSTKSEGESQDVA